MVATASAEQVLALAESIELVKEVPVPEVLLPDSADQLAARLNERARSDEPPTSREGMIAYLKQQRG